MQRIIQVPNSYGIGTDKYRINLEYDENWSVYDYITPSGFKVHQHYMITDGERKIVCQPYNNMCKDELLDAIDRYEETGKLGLRATSINDVYYIHPNGTINL